MTTALTFIGASLAVAVIINIGIRIVRMLREDWKGE
jgi:hypothetical protein